MPQLKIGCVACLAVALLPAVAAATDYAGRYAGSGLTVTLVADGDHYRGDLGRGGQTFPLTAREAGDHLAGSFTAGGTSYDFTASRRGDTMTFASGKGTYTLTAAPPPPPPVDNTAAPLAAYTVVAHTTAGCSLIREFPAGTTPLAALRRTFPDLARYFGVRPAVVGAYEDHRDHRLAFVSFTVEADHQPLVGFAAARTGDAGTAVIVVFASQSVTRDQWAELTARPTAASHAATDLDSQMAAVPLTNYTFPDGTGAAGLAPGWTPQFENGRLFFAGPSGQSIRMGMGQSFNTPNSPGARVPGGATGPLPYNADMTVALESIINANNPSRRRAGMPTVRPERIISAERQPPRNTAANTHRACITYDVTATERDGTSRPQRIAIDIEEYPTSATSWTDYIYYQCIAPRATFRQDYPVMMAMVFSVSENVAAVQAKSQREILAANATAEARRAAAGRIAQAHYAATAAAQATADARMQQTRDIEHDSDVRQRNAANFDEVIRGERTVEDTQTGEQFKAPLGDVHQIVDHLNETEPDRFHEIPLKDELYPVPGREHEPDYLQR